MNTYADSITAAQARYLNGLLDAAVIMLDRKFGITMIADTEAGAAIQGMRGRIDQMTKREASAAITTAKANNKILSDEIASLEEDHGIPPVETPEHTYVSEVGMYRVNDRIFKVLPSRQSDRRYAKELIGESESGYRFQYAKGAMNMIRPEHRMNTDEERDFGRITGHCIDCGKLLTDPRSIEYGKGPKCSGNYKH